MDILSFKERHLPSSAEIAAGCAPNYEPEIAMARGIMRYLVDNFPGYRWSVTVDFDPSKEWILIAIPGLMGPVIHHVLYLDTVDTNDAMARSVRKAGGEILERFRLQTKGIDRAQFETIRRAKRIISHSEAMPE